MKGFGIEHKGPLTDKEIVEFHSELTPKQKLRYWNRFGQKYDFHTFNSSKVLIIDAYNRWINYKNTRPKRDLFRKKEGA